MPVNLNDLRVVIPKRVKFESGLIPFVVTESKQVKIRIVPDGEVIAVGTVPVGKKWNVKIAAFIEEEDM